MTAREWDAATYDRVADPQTRWGAEVVARLALSGDERVLDAGCGTGRVTELLLDRLPRGSVVALDGSSSMIEQARRRFGDDGRVEYLVADLTAPLPIGEAVDGVFSTATFHWIGDHQALFRNLHAVLRPGGWLVAQCGGLGNLSAVRDVLRDIAPTIPWDKNFASPADTLARLASAGFADARAWLHAEPTMFSSRETLALFLRTVVLGAIVERLPESERDPFAREVASRLPRAELDYVRLNIEARKPVSPVEDF